MGTQLHDLCPYKSLVLAEFKPSVTQATRHLDEILDDIEKVLNLGGGTQNLQLASKAPAQNRGGLEVGFLHFNHQQQASWTNDPQVVDVLNQLALVCRFKRLVAIYLSEPGLRNRLTDRFKDTDCRGLSILQRIPRARLNEAFLQGEARTLWLSGIHRRTAVKADSKVLSGIDLRAALNPLDDQTYDFTAARCVPEISHHRAVVGIAPGRSRVWFGVSKNWSDFEVATTELLEHLHKTTTQNLAPFPVIATPVTDGSKVKDAFDVSFQPPELAADDISGAHHDLTDLEQWAYESNFEVTSTNGASLSARLTLNQKVIGQLDIAVNLTDPENVAIHATGTAASAEGEAVFQQALRLCNYPNWISIRYDSGHTISDGTIKEIRHRDIPFTGFRFVDLKGFAVDKEKPTPLTEIGRQNSLFCWVQQHWPIPNGSSRSAGWLVCDDGAMEIADFIHLGLEAGIPVITLIHVKGAGSKESDRGISVSKYEVVTGQAVKNLRFLDSILLEAGLAYGLTKQVGKLVWRDRMPATRKAFLNELKKIGANFKRRVVIVQPHVTEVAHNLAQNNAKSPTAARLRQLDTLLIGAEINCRALGAEFIVIGAK